MTVRELQAGESSSLEVDVCVVGAGPAGCFVAAKLAARGWRVVVLEAGGDAAVEGDAIDFVPDGSSSWYSAAREGRAFGVGGTSARWGGVILPHSAWDADGADREPDAAPWASVVRVVGERSARVRSALGVSEAVDYGEYPKDPLGDLHARMVAAGLRIGCAEMLPFRSRNLRRLLAEGAGRDVLVMTGAVAATWGIDRSSGRVTELSAVSRSGGNLRVRAGQVIVAAGAIESARILLEIDAASEGQVLAGRRAIGVGLGDHLSVLIGEVEAEALALAADRFAPRFHGGVMRTLRFADDTSLRSGVRHFAHFVFPIDSPGFQLAKKVLFGLQARKLPRVSVGEMLEASGSLMALGFDRVVRSKLHVPEGTKVGLQLDVEQARVESNRVGLSEERDAYGRRRTHIEWRITDEDQERIRLAAEAFFARWSSVGGAMPRVRPTTLSVRTEKLHDAYHPVGVTRLGSDSDAVLDMDLRVRGTANLHVVSTGIFPTAGTANPTFSMLCLADALVERLRKG